jgi:hypothetical protein
MDVTLLGIVTDVRPEQPKKAKASILVKEVGILIERIVEQ